MRTPDAETQSRKYFSPASFIMQRSEPLHNRISRMKVWMFYLHVYNDSMVGQGDMVSTRKVDLYYFRNSACCIVLSGVDTFLERKFRPEIIISVDSSIRSFHGKWHCYR